MTADQLQHAPTCTRPGATTTAGFSVLVTRCDGCGAVTTTRHVHHTPEKEVTHGPKDT